MYIYIYIYIYINIYIYEYMYSGRDCVKSLRSSCTVLYSQTNPGPET